MEKYVVQHCNNRPDLDNWDAPSWRQAGEVRLLNALPLTGDHRPDTRVKMLYGDDGLHGIFKVADRFVRAVNIGNQAMVCLDSCVEFFVQPAGCRNYLNFEMNCGGSLLCFDISDHRRTNGGFAAYSKLKDAELDTVVRRASLPLRVEPEITVPTTWTLGFFIPLALLAAHFPGIGEPRCWRGQVWRAGFFKCADETSHPHWLTWTAITEHNFHLPEHFGELHFA